MSRVFDRTEREHAGTSAPPRATIPQPPASRPHAPQNGPLCDPAFLPDVCRLLLEHLLVLPCRMQLDTEAADATVPMLRGVWGKAVHELFPEIYGRVFDVGSAPGSVAVSPPYVIRAAPPFPEWVPAVEIILIGSAIEYSRELDKCWEYAGREGLGKLRRPFEIRRRETILPDESTGVDGDPWPLAQAGWPLSADAPCRLVFPAPLRLRRKGRLIESPTLADLVAALNRRIAGYLPERYRSLWLQLGRQLLELAKQTPQTSWQGTRLDLVRYSGRQKTELELHGVSGSLELPRGPGVLLPLLAAAQWLHVGKNTVMGMGQLLVEPLQ